MNNTSCNPPRVVLEPEIHGPRGKERQSGVADTQAASSVLSAVAPIYNIVSNWLIRKFAILASVKMIDNSIVMSQ